MVKRQKLASTKVCDVEVELELLAESSFFEQEMMVRLKRDMRIMYKTLFIFSSIPKVKYYGLVVGEPKLYQNMWCFTRIGDFTWNVSDCEKLVRVFRTVPLLYPI